MAGVILSQPHDCAPVNVVNLKRDRFGAKKDFASLVHYRYFVNFLHPTRSLLSLLQLFDPDIVKWPQSEWNFPRSQHCDTLRLVFASVIIAIELENRETSKPTSRQHDRNMKVLPVLLSLPRAFDYSNKHFQAPSSTKQRRKSPNPINIQ